MHKTVKYLFIICTFSLVSACATKVEKYNFPELTYTHLQKINLNVSDIEIQQAWQPSLQYPHIEHETPISLLKTATRWAEDVFIPAGESGKAIIIISEASIIEEALDKNYSITGAFTTEQSERYTSKLAVEIKVQDAIGNQAATNSTASRSLTVAEDISLIDRERVWFGLVEDTVSDMDKKIRSGVDNYLKNYLG